MSGGPERLFPGEVLPATCLKCGGLLPVATAASATLRISLELAVPVHIHDMARWSSAHRTAAAGKCATIVGSHGDALQFGGKHAAECFNALARGLAIAAYQPGGASFAGMHWCVPSGWQTQILRSDPPAPDIVTADVVGGVL